VKRIALSILSIIILGSSPMVFANMETDKKLEFAGALEETLGHFWALELNLDKSNSELALIHATHPISELYDTMSEHLESNPEFNEKLQQTLLELKDKATTSTTRNNAQLAIEDAKKIIQEARDIVIGDEHSNNSPFKAQLINGLLETSKVEYEEAIQNGEIIEMAEFQDGSAFIWRSQQIFEEIRYDVKNSGQVSDTYAKIWEGYEQKHSPQQVSSLVNELITHFESVSGVESTESSHLEEVFGTEIKHPLELSESIQMTGKINEGENISSLPPLKQIKEGVAPTNVQCKTSMELVFKISGEPACVKSISVQKLASRGWTQ
jgi:hypothetical protein